MEAQSPCRAEKIGLIRNFFMKPAMSTRRLSSRMTDACEMEPKLVNYEDQTRDPDGARQRVAGQGTDQRQYWTGWQRKSMRYKGNKMKKPRVNIWRFPCSLLFLPVGQQAVCPDSRTVLRKATD